MRYVTHVVVFVIPFIALAQEAAGDNLHIVQAKRIKVSDVVMKYHKEIGLTPEESRKLRDVRNGLQRVYRQKIYDSLDIEPGKRVVGDPVELGRRQTPEERAELESIHDAKTQAIESFLSPEQRKVAEYYVLQRRMRIAGVQGVVASTDLSVVDLSGLSHSPQEIIDELEKAEIESRRKVNLLDDRPSQAIGEIRERELEAVMERLGPDADVIRSIIKNVPPWTTRPEGFAPPRPSLSGPLGR